MTPHPVDLEALEKRIKLHWSANGDDILALISEVRAARQALEEMERAWKESQRGWLDEIAKAKVELAYETQQVADARQQLYDTNEAHNDIVAENTRIREERDAYGAENALLRDVLEKAIKAQHEVQPDTVSGDVVSEGWEMCLACAFDGWPCEDRACWVYQARAALASPSVPPPIPYPVDDLFKITDPAPPVLEEKAQDCPHEGPCAVVTFEKAAQEAGEETAALKEGGGPGKCHHPVRNVECDRPAGHDGEHANTSTPTLTIEELRKLLDDAVPGAEELGRSLKQVFRQPGDLILDAGAATSVPRGAPPRAPAALPKEEVAPLVTCLYDVQPHVEDNCIDPRPAPLPEEQLPKEGPASAGGWSPTDRLAALPPMPWVLRRTHFTPAQHCDIVDANGKPFFTYPIGDAAAEAFAHWAVRAAVLCGPRPEPAHLAAPAPGDADPASDATSAGGGERG